MTSFSSVAPRKVISISRNGPIKQAAAIADHFHTFQMAMNASMLVTTIVPVTAMP